MYVQLACNLVSAHLFNKLNRKYFEIVVKSSVSETNSGDDKPYLNWSVRSSLRNSGLVWNCVVERKENLVVSKNMDVRAVWPTFVVGCEYKSYILLLDINSTVANYTKLLIGEEIIILISLTRKHLWLWDYENCFFLGAKKVIFLSFRQIWW